MLIFLCKINVPLFKVMADLLFNTNSLHLAKCFIEIEMMFKR